MPLDLQTKVFLDQLAEQNPPGWETLTPAEGRELFAGLVELFGVGPAVHTVFDRVLGDSVPVRIYVPHGDGPFPIVMYFHGGGWVLGSLDTHDAVCRRLAERASCVVVSVQYRLSPEHKYPAALEDCFSATRFVAEHADAMGGDARRLAVAGDSAGGNLAAAVAMMARDRGGPDIRLQLLLYPITNHRFDTSSYEDFAEGFGLTKAAMVWFWQQYLRQDDDGRQPYASLLEAEDLKNLPPAYVITAEYDVLRDEGEAYAARLQEAGVPVVSRHYEGVIHGFTQFSGVFDKGKQSLDEAARALDDALRA